MQNRYEYSILEAISNAVRTVKAAPLVLGGVTGSGGGIGGPIGGFVGFLPQTRVAYDLSEIASSGTPLSGMSLLDNLNHIRYRLDMLGSGTFLDLDDTPDTYSGYVGKAVIVNPSETGLTFGSAGVWGEITGTLSSQTDLQTALDSKLDDVQTAYRVLVTDTSGNVITTTYMQWSETTKQFSMGDPNPVTGDGSFIQAGPDGAAANYYMQTFSNSNFGSRLAGFRARNTKSAPSGVQSGDFGLRLVSFFADNTGVFETSAAAQIRLNAASTHTTTDHASQIEFHATPQGSTTLGKIMTLDGITAIIHKDLKLDTVGYGVYIKEGSNATMGTATLVAGTVVVSTTKVTANSRIFLTTQSLGTVAVPKAIAVTAVVASTSFTITSADVTDTSIVAWLIVEPS